MFIAGAGCANRVQANLPVYCTYIANAPLFKLTSEYSDVICMFIAGTGCANRVQANLPVYCTYTAYAPPPFSSHIKHIFKENEHKLSQNYHLMVCLQRKYIATEKQNFLFSPAGDIFGAKHLNITSVNKHQPSHARVSAATVWPQHYCNTVSNPVTTEEVSGAVTHMDLTVVLALQTCHI